MEKCELRFEVKAKSCMPQEPPHNLFSFFKLFELGTHFSFGLHLKLHACFKMEKKNFKKERKRD
jgi:hypothetical protein